jgi:hypothetical protein
VDLGQILDLLAIVALVFLMFGVLALYSSSPLLSYIPRKIPLEHALQKGILTKKFVRGNLGSLEDES